MKHENKVKLAIIAIIYMLGMIAYNIATDSTVDEIKYSEPITIHHEVRHSGFIIER